MNQLPGRLAKGQGGANALRYSRGPEKPQEGLAYPRLEEKPEVRLEGSWLWRRTGQNAVQL